MSGPLSTSTWAWVSIAGVAGHALLFGLLHVLEPQLDPASRIISDYAATDSASIATVALLAFASVWLGLALALSGAAPGSVAVAAGRVLFALGVVGITAGAFFPSTMDPRTPSLVAQVQNLVARPGLFLGVVLVSAGLRGAPGWAGLGARLLGLAVGAFATLVFTITVLLERDLGGIGQRAIFVMLYVWALLIAARILRPEK